jgi:hypothetical protein
VRIALDARKLFDGGIGTYIRELLSALSTSYPQDEWIALVDPADAGRVRWRGPVLEHPVHARKYGLAEHVVVPAEARRAGAELLHAPHYTLPLGWSGPSVVTIHDLIHIRFARFHRPGTALYARLMAGLAARRAAVVIADSEATKRDVVELLGTRAERVRVVPLGVSRDLKPADDATVARFLAERRLPERYVLYVGARTRTSSCCCAPGPRCGPPNVRRSCFPASRGARTNRSQHSRARSAWRAGSGSRASCATTSSSPASTAAPRCSSSHRSPRASACRRSRPWRAACRCSRAMPARFLKCWATPA